jgi:hypothetical protein
MFTQLLGRLAAAVQICDLRSWEVRRLFEATKRSECERPGIGSACYYRLRSSVTEIQLVVVDSRLPIVRRLAISGPYARIQTRR